MSGPIELSAGSGRKVAAQLSGDPEGGPLVFFHGTPGSRLYVPPETISTEEHARVATFDRPGYGGSDPVPHGTTVAAVVSDVLPAITAFVGAPISVVGSSGGCPYALAGGALLPESVAATAVVSADAPPRLPPDPTELSDAEIALIELARRDPSAAADVVAGEAEAFARDPLVYHSRPRTGPDAAARARPGVPEMLERSALEAGRQGSAGLVTDWLAEALPWGFTLADVQRPVEVWYGSDDPGPAPKASARLLDEIPDAREHRVDRAGHELLLTHWRSILRSLRNTDRS